MSNKKSTDELPKKEVAKKVITAKRRYFLPTHGISVEAESVEEAVTKVKGNKKKEGDES